MAPRTVWGKSAWGASFLQALQQLDVDKRIERGKTIANTNKVLDFNLTGNRITGKVKGNFAPFYNIELQFRTFTDAEAEQLYSAIASSPLLLGSILGGELPSELLTRLTAAGVRLLPDSWEEVRGSCTCPDFTGGGGYRGGSALRAGNPCKHMTATYYMLTNEIDKDPFSLFRLRGCDLVAHFALSQAAVNSAVPNPLRLEFAAGPGAAKPSGASTRPASPRDGGGDSAADGRNDTADSDVPAPVMAQVVLPPVAVPRLRSSSAFVLSCLVNDPPFCRSVNFKEALAEMFALVGARGKGVKGLFQFDPPLQLEEADRERLVSVLQQGRWELRLARNITDAHVFLHSALLKGGSGAPSSRSSVGVGGSGASDGGAGGGSATFKASDVLGSVPHSVLPEGGAVRFGLLAALRLWLFLPAQSMNASPSCHFFRSLAALAQALLVSCTFVPDVLPLADDASRFKVVWKPLTSHGEVEEAVAALARAYPSGGASRTGQEACAPCVYVDQRPLASDSGVSAGLTAALTTLLHSLGFMHKAMRVAPPPESRTFFSGALYTCATVAQRGTAASISKWVRVFELLKVPLRLELRVAEAEGPAAAAAAAAASGNGADLPIAYKYSLMIGRRRPASAPGMEVEMQTVRSFLASCSVSEERPAVLRLVSAIMSHLPGVSELVSTRDDAPLTGQNFERFVMESMSLLSALGVRMVVPKCLERVVRPRPVVRVRGVAAGCSAGRSHLGGDNLLGMDSLLQFEWQVALGEHSMDLAEFRRLAASGARLIRYKNTFVAVEPEDLETLARAMAAPPGKPTAVDVLRAALDPESGTAFWLDAAERAAVHGLIGTREQPVPAGVTATLRPYQLRGYQWLVSLLSNGFGCCLADDMGLGKTIQTICALVYLKQSGRITPSSPALVVAPTTLLDNWQREVHKFAPGILSVALHYGADRQLSAQSGGDGGKAPAAKKARKGLAGGGGAEVILTSYGTLRSDIADFKRHTFSIVVIDEAQAIKNSNTQAARSIKSLKTSMRLALSGTPVENRLAELHSIYDFILPDHLGTVKEFNKLYAKPIEADHDAEALSCLHRMTAPFLMRRLKTDANIIADLPRKVEADVFASLTPEQAALYESTVQDIMQRIETGEAKHRGGLIFSLMLRLKQICNHPATYLPDKYPGTADQSGKLRLLLDLLEPALEAGEKVLVFSQFVSMQDLLAKAVRERFFRAPLLLRGDMGRQQRDAAVQRFQTDPSVQVFIISLKAGGVGLNLTAANHVVHYDLWWNPAVQNQATDRAFRIGQTKTVFVHRLITKGTMEEKISAMMQRKKELSELSVSEGETWLGKLNNNEIRELFALN